MTELEVLQHASDPGACSRPWVPNEAVDAAEAGLITLRDAGYQQETVYLWDLTEAGRVRLAELS